MAIVSNAIVLSFHLKTEPSKLELRMAKPLGIVFWALSLCCLGLGVVNYISTSPFHDLYQSSLSPTSSLSVYLDTLLGTELE